MKRWPTKLFLSVCDIQGGTQPPKSTFKYKPTDGFIRLIQIRDFDSDEDLTFVPANMKLKRCVESDVMIARYGASLGRILRGKAGAYNVALVKTLPDESQLTKGFLYYWLSSPSFQEYLAKVGNRAAQAGFNKNDLARIEIPVPPLAEQERIAGLLDEANELRKLRARADHRTRALLSGLFHKMFGDPMENPRWPVQPVSSFVSELQGGRNVNPAGADEASSRFRVLKVSAVTWGEFQPDESKPVPADYEPPSLHLVRTGDLLFSRANTTELVGATSYVFDTPPNLLLPDKLWRFVWKKSPIIEPLFIWWLLQTKSVRGELGQRATGTSGSMKNISKPKLMTLPVPIPPLQLQSQFAHLAIQIREFQAMQAGSRQRLDDLFKSMLHRAFNEGL
jgi:type I restriction enzyme S subunit